MMCVYCQAPIEIVVQVVTDVRMPVVDIDEVDLAAELATAALFHLEETA